MNHPVIDFSNLLDDHYVAAGRRHFRLKQGRHKDLELERAAPRSVCIPIVPVIALSLAQEAGRHVLEPYVSEKAGKRGSKPSNGFKIALLEVLSADQTFESQQQISIRYHHVRLHSFVETCPHRPSLDLNPTRSLLFDQYPDNHGIHQYVAAHLFEP